MPFHKQMAKQRRPLRTKALTTQLTDTGQQLNATNADFLIIDVETALTFTQLALETDNQEKKVRNRKNARKAYDTILHLWDNVTFTPTQEGHMHEMIGRLKSDLELLGEKF
jgi:hypothetical protein